MFKKTIESVQNVEVYQRNLDIKMEYRDTDVLLVKKYFNQKEEELIN
jgi:hypothetical protein